MEIDYIAHTNKLKNIDSSIKLIVAIGLMILVFVVGIPEFSFLIAFLIGILLIFIAKVPIKFYLKFISVPFTFTLLTCIVMVFFFGSGTIIYETGILGIVVREDALTLGILTFSRTLACFSVLGFLAMTTPIAEILNELYIVKVPKIFIEIALLMYTVIFVFLEQVKTMTHAQQTRMGYNGLNNSYRSLGLLAANLFFRSLDKSEQLQHALDSRGYSGELPKYNP